MGLRLPALLVSLLPRLVFFRWLTFRLVVVPWDTVTQFCIRQHEENRTPLLMIRFETRYLLRSGLRQAGISTNTEARRSIDLPGLLLMVQWVYGSLRFLFLYHLG